MHYRYSQHQSSSGSGKHFETVAENDYEVGAQTREFTGHA